MGWRAFGFKGTTPDPVLGCSNPGFQHLRAGGCPLRNESGFLQVPSRVPLWLVLAAACVDAGRCLEAVLSWHPWAACPQAGYPAVLPEELWLSKPSI